MIVEYHELRGLLQNNLLKILFVKKDGTEREMYCTLMPETIKHTLSSDKEKTNTQTQNRVLAVYDTKVQGWRSMIVENIISYSVVKQ